MKHPTLMEILVPRVEAAFHRASGPLFVGEVSAEIGYNIEYTMEAIEALLVRGVLRHATAVEVENRLGMPGSNVFALAVAQNLGKAYAP